MGSVEEPGRDPSCYTFIMGARMSSWGSKYGTGIHIDPKAACRVTPMAPRALCAGLVAGNVHEDTMTLGPGSVHASKPAGGYH